MCIYQRCPVCVQISNFQRWHKLGTGHHQEVEIKEELELLVENLRGEQKTRTQRGERTCRQGEPKKTKRTRHDDRAGGMGYCTCSKVE